MRARWVVVFLLGAFVAALAAPAASAPQELAPPAVEAPVAEPAPLVPAEAPREPSPAERLLASGVDAWLSGHRERATEAWRAALAERPPRALRAALLYNLGNAAWHADRPLEAVGWYTAALPLAPREPDLLDNLDLARRAADLAPRDRGDLASALERYVGLWTNAEARWLAFIGLLPLLVALLGEALRGGVGWRLTAFFALLLALFAALPWAEQRRRAEFDAGLVVAPGGARLLPDPAGAVGAPAAAGAVVIDPGERVRRLDALPGWVRVESPFGARGWIRAEEFFDLDP